MTCQYCLLYGGRGRDALSFCQMPIRKPRTGRPQTTISLKMKFWRKSNTTTQQHNILGIITNSGIRIEGYKTLYFRTLLLLLYRVVFVVFCWVSVGFVLCFAPFCCVLNVETLFGRSVKSCKCCVLKTETQQKPTPDEGVTQRNPTEHNKHNTLFAEAKTASILHFNK